MLLKCTLPILLIPFFTQYLKAEYGNSGIINGTELIFTFLVHRHGDRTPITPDLYVSKDPEALQRIIDKYGYGQLTPRGLYRGYQIGQFIRSRYSSFLSPRYNQSEIYLRSTDITRTKMTILTAMAAVYPPTKDNWSQDISWTPVPYTTEDVYIDYVLSYGNCPKYVFYTLTFKPNLPQFKETLEKWSQITGTDFVNYPQEIYPTYDGYACQHSLGIPLIDALEDIWPEIEEAADAATEASFGNEDYLPLLTGVLLNEFFKASFAQINGYDAPRVRVYSAHDINVFGMIAASKVKREARPGVPKFGSIFALELRRVTKTGKYVVLVVYVPDPSKEEVLYLPVEGCDGLLCDFDNFRSITSQFLLNKHSLKKACKLGFDFALPKIE